MVEHKKCTKCEEIKHVCQFHRNKQNKDGYHSYCKECRNSVKRQYYIDIKLGHRETKKQTKKKIDYNSLPLSELVVPNETPKNILINKKLKKI